jgi:uncharacterized membrane protein YkvA (DUF1232 family)
VSLWEWGLVAAASIFAFWSGFVVWLWHAGRQTDARALVGFVPDCFVLLTRLLRERRVSRRRKLVLVALIAYLAFPFDVVPDFIPVAGQVDDVLAVALLLRLFIRSGDEPLVRQLWPGPQRSLELLLRVAGASAAKKDELKPLV